jgi:hypothetical protein
MPGAPAWHGRHPPRRNRGDLITDGDLGRAETTKPAPVDTSAAPYGCAQTPRHHHACVTLWLVITPGSSAIAAACKGRERVPKIKPTTETTKRSASWQSPFAACLKKFPIGVVTISTVPRARRDVAAIFLA